MRGAGLLAILMAALALEACWLGDVSLEDKACPCVSPWTCDPATQRCVRPELLKDGGASEDAAGADAAGADAEGADALPGDAGLAADAAPALDAGAADAAMDAGVEDAASLDAAPGDGATADAAPFDAAPLDAAPADAAPFDAAPLDASPADAAPLDASPADAAPLDASPGDAAPRDASAPDTGGASDAGAPADAGAGDAGPPDAGAMNLPLGAACTAHAECATRQCLGIVVGGLTRQVCATGCSSTSDCPSSFACLNVASAPYCLSEGVFSPPLDFSTPSGGACSASASTCQSGACDTADLVCRERCWRESDCASFGGSCATLPPDNRSVCDARGTAPLGAGCAVDNDCITGICERSSLTCAAHCCAAQDCPNGQSCVPYLVSGTSVYKVCMARRSTGMLALGASCVSGAQCESEVCASLSPTGVGPRQCSTTCCEDADCALMPGGGRCWPFSASIGAQLTGMCIPP